MSSQLTKLEIAALVAAPRAAPDKKVQTLLHMLPTFRVAERKIPGLGSIQPSPIRNWTTPVASGLGRRQALGLRRNPWDFTPIQMHSPTFWCGWKMVMSPA
jgi:hypothetical protein